MAKITDFEVVDHGTDGASYFPGCGVVFTEFEHIKTGVGDTCEEALEDALDSIATSGIADGTDFEALSLKLKGFGADGVSASEEAPDNDEWHYYVSIRYNVEVI